ncbi:MAG: ABC-F family ATP-binding cassette domain-containing protein [bacterium]|nr:ABC-F family ATP-binding cassette domain-containing protein [bacterium]
MLTLADAHFDFGRERILRGASFAVYSGQKCALVGPNGAGKTTLLNILAGEIALQGGSRSLIGGTQLKYLRQETTLEVGAHGGPGRVVDAVADAAFARERQLERELADVSARLAAPHDEAAQQQYIREQGRLQEEFDRRGGYTMQARLEAALSGVGLPRSTWQLSPERLSGGERRRAALASVLLSGADLLLLDEPTNHLDLESCEWLENFLAQCRGAAIIVSHDRWFLDRATTRTLHLNRGRIDSYSGNYTFFDEQSLLRWEQDEAAWQRQQAKIKQTEDYIRRNMEGQNTKQAQGRRKLLEREERLERPSTEPGLFRFALKSQRQSGGTVLETRGLGKGFGGRMLVRGLDLHVSKGERLGIIGPNGCGKSTLLKLLSGKQVPDEGRVVVGHNVDLGYYDQELSGVSDHNTVIAEIGSVDPTATLGELRSFLAAFGYGEDLYDRPVGQLSGGERGRLALLRLIKEGHNTLLLDEPTNHLDVRSRESLEAALRDYDGTLIVVSHDRRFLDKVVHKLLVFPPLDADGLPTGVVTLFDGGWAEWVKDRVGRTQTASLAPAGTASSSARQATTPGAAPEADAGKGGLSKNEQNRRRQWIAQAEEAILALEAEKETCFALMAAPDTGSEQRAQAGRRIIEIEAGLQKHLADWEQWHLEIEG